MHIVEFLNQRIAADEQRCALTPGGAFKVTSLEGRSEADEEAVQQYYHRFQPEWMALDLKAKRALIKREIDAYFFDGLQVGTPASTPALRILAAVYRDHGDYQPEWGI